MPQRVHAESPNLPNLKTIPSLASRCAMSRLFTARTAQSRFNAGSEGEP